MNIFLVVFVLYLNGFIIVINLLIFMSKILMFEVFLKRIVIKVMIW